MDNPSEALMRTDLIHAMQKAVNQTLIIRLSGSKYEHNHRAKIPAVDVLEADKILRQLDQLGYKVVRNLGEE